MKVTLQDIANKAGVSRGTVDRALNDRGRINKEVAEKIKGIAKELGYKPNTAGKALAMSRNSVKIGVLVQSANTPFMKTVLKGIEEAKNECEKFGIDVVIKKINDISLEKLIEYMYKLKELGCKGIALMPTNDIELKEIINKFISEYNIPIVTFNSDIDDTNRICFVGQNSFKSGQVASGLMMEIIPENGKLLIISGYPFNKSHIERTNGFIKEIKKYRKNIEILDIQYCYDDDNISEKIVKEVTNVCDDLKGIYITASGTEGVCKFIDNNKELNNIKIVANDLVKQNEKYLKKGIINFLIDQNGYLQGYQSVKILFDKIFDGNEPAEDSIYTDIVIKTKYNL